MFLRMIFTSRANRITGEKISGCFGCMHICLLVNYRRRGLNRDVSKSESLGIFLAFTKVRHFVRLIFEGCLIIFKEEKKKKKEINSLWLLAVGWFDKVFPE